MHLYLQKILISLTGPVFSRFFYLQNRFLRWRPKFKMAEKNSNIKILLPICFYIKNSLLHAFIFTKNSDFLDGPCEKKGWRSLPYCVYRYFHILSYWRNLKFKFSQRKAFEYSGLDFSALWKKLYFQNFCTNLYKLLKFFSVNCLHNYT